MWRYKKNNLPSFCVAWHQNGWPERTSVMSKLKRGVIALVFDNWPSLALGEFLCNLTRPVLVLQMDTPDPKAWFSYVGIIPDDKEIFAVFRPSQILSGTNRENRKLFYLSDSSPTILDYRGCLRLIVSLVKGIYSCNNNSTTRLQRTFGFLTCCWVGNTGG